MYIGSWLGRKIHFKKKEKEIRVFMLSAIPILAVSKGLSSFQQA